MIYCNTKNKIKISARFGQFLISSWREKGHEPSRAEPSWKSFSSSSGSSQLGSDSSLVASLSIRQFRWLSNSSRIRWPWNSCEIPKEFWSEFFSMFKWLWNSFKDFDQYYFQEFDEHKIFMKFFKDFDQNSDGQMTMKFFRS